MGPLIFLLLVLFSVPAVAGGSIGLWGGASEAAATGKRELRPSSFSEVADGQDWERCVVEILEAERRYEIPQNYLLAIALTESGRKSSSGVVAPWPWTVNAEGEGRWFDSLGEARRWVRSQQREGKNSIDIGCMQVNLRWHPAAFPDLATAFDPAANVDYAARLLRELRQQHGTWREALGRYHSHSDGLREAYTGRVEGNKRYIAAVKQALRESPAESPPSIAANEAGKTSGLSDGAALSWAGWMNATASQEIPTNGLFGSGPARPLLPQFTAAPQGKS